MFITFISVLTKSFISTLQLYFTKQQYLIYNVLAGEGEKHNISIAASSKPCMYFYWLCIFKNLYYVFTKLVEKNISVHCFLFYL